MSSSDSIGDQNWASRDASAVPESSTSRLTVKGRVAMRRYSPALLAIALATAGAAAFPAEPAAAAGPIQSAVFMYQGAPDSWTPPAGVGQIRVTAWGGSGTTSDGHRGLGGGGAVIQTILDLVPGDSFKIEVGGQGGHWGPRSAGWPNGGRGGQQGGSPGNDGGGGGGSSNVYLNRLTHPGRTFTVVVAGGGGGGGGNQLGIGSGGNGGSADLNGLAYPGSPGTANLICASPGAGGLPGNSSGGLGSPGLDCGGTYRDVDGDNGQDSGYTRIAAAGGNGATAQCCVGGGGGGGGGGYGGGGGGGAPSTFGGGGDGGGPGGSATAAGTDLKQENFGDGKVLIEWIVGSPISATVRASSGASDHGTPLTINAKLSPVPTGGTVQFTVDGQNVGSPVAVDTTAGTATSDPIPTLSVGNHTVGMYYSGVTDFPAGTAIASATASQPIVVNPDTDPPAATLTAPTPPAGHNGYFNTTDLANAGGSITASVSAADISGTVTALACTDNGSPLTIVNESGSNPRTGTVSVSSNGSHALSCTGTESNGNTGSTGGANTAAIKIDTTTPSLAVPATPYAVDATSPLGALVTAYPVSASDPDPGDAPSITCSPATPNQFAIGGTTVSCYATDQATNSTTSQSFTVHVKGATEQLDDLAAAVQGIHTGNSLSEKLANAKQDVVQGNTSAACGTLGAFVNEASAQRGKKIPAAQADQLIAGAQRVQAVIGC